MKKYLKLLKNNFTIFITIEQIFLIEVILSEKNPFEIGF
jgi:hypothetical protein